MSHFRIFFDEFRVYLVEESAGITKLYLAITETVLSTRQHAMFFGSCDGDIQQTTLLLQFAKSGRSDGTGEDILLKTNDKDGRKLKTLRGMYRHERHTRLVVIALAVQICQQCHILQVVRKCSLIFSPFFTTFLHKVLHTTKELFQILLSGKIVRIFITIKDICTDSTLLNNSITQVVDIHPRSFFYESANHQAEVLQLSERSLID